MAPRLSVKIARICNFGSTVELKTSSFGIVNVHADLQMCQGSKDDDFIRVVSIEEHIARI